MSRVLTMTSVVCVEKQDSSQELYYSRSILPKFLVGSTIGESCRSSFKGDFVLSCTYS